MSKFPLFKSKEEAEKATGYFGIISIKITGDLARKICAYAGEKNLGTWISSDHTKRYTAVYTLEFEIKTYFKDQAGNPIDVGYIGAGGKQGSLKGELKNSYALYGNSSSPFAEEGDRRYSTGEVEAYYTGFHERHTIHRLRRLRKDTPSIDQIYFWICRKYPDHILWVEYTTKKYTPSKLTSPLDFGFPD